MPSRPASTTRARVQVLEDGRTVVRRDTVTTEEPLEVRLDAGGIVTPVAVTMRTPGDDFALAAGLLHSEGILGGRDELRQIDYCTDITAQEQAYNVVTVGIRGPVPDLSGMERRGTMSSACGVCGKTSLEALKVRGVPPPAEGPRIDAEMLYSLPDKLRAAQATFAATGGLHAAGLFTAAGEPLLVREDVGRHNAVDKVVGQELLDDRLPLRDQVLVVSGRAGFEVVQKALVAGIAVLCAVSAPSSLAVALAEEFGMTLVGFLRGRRCNVYAGADRLR
ncbi:MAG TPA: formate dehydrogenase accessory sulfurtransferase FdhD [Mycobacteriales bacterium]|jgi:FdhD protein